MADIIGNKLASLEQAKQNKQKNLGLKKLEITGAYDADSVFVPQGVNPTNTGRLLSPVEGTYLDAPELKVDGQLNQAGINARIQADNAMMGVTAPNIPADYQMTPQDYKLYTEAMNPALQERQAQGLLNVQTTGETAVGNRPLYTAESEGINVGQYLLDQGQARLQQASNQPAPTRDVTKPINIYTESDTTGGAIASGALNLAKNVVGFTDDITGGAIDLGTQAAIEQEIEELNFKSPATVDNVKQAWNKFKGNKNLENTWELMTTGLKAGWYATAESLPYMVATRNPYTMALATIGIANDFAEGRAEAEGREATATDNLKALPFATLAMGLEKLGVDVAVVNPFIAAAKSGATKKAAKILGGIAGEYGTETVQSALEGTYKTLGTKEWKGLEDTMWDAHWNGVVGGLAGGETAAIATGVGSVPGVVKTVTEQAGKARDTVRDELTKQTPEEAEIASVQAEPTELKNYNTISKAYNEVTQSIETQKDLKDNANKISDLVQSAEQLDETLDTEKELKIKIEKLSQNVNKEVQTIREVIAKRPDATVAQIDKQLQSRGVKLLGSKQSILESMGVAEIDYTDQEIDTLGKIAGATQAQIDNAKAIRKTAVEVQQEVIEGPKGLKAYTKQLEGALKAGDTSGAQGAYAKMKNLYQLQSDKYKAIRQAMRDAQKTGQMQTATWGTNGKYEVNPTSLEATQNFLDSSVVVEGSQIKDALEKYKKVDKPVAKKTNKKPAQQPAIEPKKTATKASSKGKPEVAVETTTEPKSEPTVEETKGKIKEKKQEAIDVIKSNPTVKKVMTGVAKTLDKIKIKSKGEKIRAKDRDFIAEFGTMRNNQVYLDQPTQEAMSIAYIQYIAIEAANLLFPDTNRVEEFLGKESLSPADLAEFRDKGALRKNVVDTLGNLVASHLDINLDKDMDYAKANNIKIALGNNLLAVLINKGILEQVNVSAEVWNNHAVEGKEIKDKNKSVPFVRTVDTSKNIDKINAAREIIESIPELSDMDKRTKKPVYRKTAPKDRTTHEYRKRSGEMSAQDHERLNKQEQIEHTLKGNVYRTLDNLGEFAKIAAGYVDKDVLENSTHWMKAESIKAQNAVIERSLAQAQEHREAAQETEGSYFFRYFMSGNGRDMIDSNTFNPQSNKIHRHLEYTGKPTFIRMDKDIEAMEVFKHAVLQGLGESIDKKSKESLENIWSQLMANEDVKNYAYWATDTDKLPRKEAKELAEFAASKKKLHTIDALVALGEYLRAVDAKRDIFDTTLQIEVDAVTSGWILALLQNPAFSYNKVESLLRKGGVYLNDNEAVYQDLNESKAEPDTYETLMEKIQFFLNKETATASDGKTKITGILSTVLPVDRDFAKSIFMTHITYGAGINGVVSDVTEQFADKLYNKVVDFKNKMRNSKKDETTLSTIKREFNQFRKDMKELGINIPANADVDFTLDNKSVGNLINVVTEYYGESIKTAISSEFQEFTKTRDVVNTAFQQMFIAYDKAYKEEFKKLKESKEVVTQEDLDNLEERLKPLIPTIKSPNGTDVQIFSREKMDALDENDYTVTSSFLQPIDNSGIGNANITTTGEVKRLQSARASGGVVPIHFIDGAVIGEILSQFQMTGVYDAGMLNVKDAKAATQMYNKQLMKVSKNYNLLEEVIKAAKKSGTVDTKVITNLQKRTKIANANRKKIHSADQNIQHFAYAGVKHESKSTSTSTVKKKPKQPIQVKTRELKSQAKVNPADKYSQIANTVDNDPEVMLELYEELGADDRIDLSAEHDQRLQNVLQTFINKSKKYIPEMNIYLAENAEENGGIINIDKDNIRLAKGSKPQTSALDMSMKEVYVHEVIHAATEYAKQFNAPEAEPTLNRLRQLHEAALKEIKLEDLMPKDSMFDRETDEKNAKELLDYISNNLSEFIAVGLTNETVAKKLAEIEVKPTKNSEATNLFDKLLNFVTELYEKIFMKFRGEEGIKADTLLMKLSLELAQANNKATQHHKKNLLAKVFDKLDALNKYVKIPIEMIKKYSDKVELPEYYKSKSPEDYTLPEALYFLAKTLVKLPYDERVQEVYSQLMSNVFHQYPEDSLQTIFREFKNPDELMRQLESLGLVSNNIDNFRREIEQTNAKALTEEFTRKLTAKEQVALGTMIVENDLDVLGEDIEYLTEILENDSSRQVEIEALESEINNIVDGKDVNYYLNQAEGLGFYMAKHEVAYEGQLLNARAIANKLNAGGKLNVEKGLVEAIDKLATLYGVEYSTQVARTITADLMKSEPNGITAIMKMNQAHKKLSDETIFKDGTEWINKIKGYSKEVLDPDVSIKIEPVSKTEELAKEGFQRVQVMQKHPGDQTKEPLAVFINEWHVTPTYNRYNFRLTQKKAKGTSLKNAHVLTDNGQFNSEKIIANIAAMNRAQKEAIKKSKKTRLKPTKKRYMLPSLNSKGQASDFRYVMSKANKATLLKRDNRVFQMMGRMQASVYDKVESKEHNKKLVDTAYEDFINNYEKKPKDYVEISENSPTPEMAEAWELLPKETKMYIEEVFGEDQPLVIRRDMFHRYMGQREQTLANSRFIKTAPKTMRELGIVLERIIKEMMKIVKVDIVIKTPAVLIDNILSNFFLSVELGMDPISVAKMQLQGIRALNRYRELHHEMVKLEQREKAGLKYDKERLSRIKAELSESPVKDLMEYGLFQAIIEDVDIEESKHQGKVRKYIERKVEQTPGWVQTAGNYAYMTDKTILYKGLMKATQYSDFVARYALYQSRVKQGQDPKTAKELVLDAFINYDVPDAKILQYLNDMGFVMFTKYFMRIQKAIKRGMIDEKPIQMIGAIALQEGLGDVPDVLDQSILDKNYSNILHFYGDHIKTLLMPSGWEALDEYVI